MRRRGWPVSTAPPPDAVDLGVKGWTNVLDQALLGWEVFDVIKIFEDDDNFFADWHESLGDTCGPPLLPAHAAPQCSLCACMCACRSSVHTDGGIWGGRTGHGGGM